MNPPLIGACMNKRTYLRGGGSLPSVVSRGNVETITSIFHYSGAGFGWLIIPIFPIFRIHLYFQFSSYFHSLLLDVWWKCLDHMGLMHVVQLNFIRNWKIWGRWAFFCFNFMWIQKKTVGKKLLAQIPKSCWLEHSNILKPYSKMIGKNRKNMRRDQ